jgi:hypothetical protein
MSDEHVEPRYPFFLNALEMEQFVMDYLHHSSGATDDERGIADQWLKRHQIRVELPLLHDVLRRMVDAGKLEVIGTTRPCYRLPAGRAGRKCGGD